MMMVPITYYYQKLVFILFGIEILISCAVTDVNGFERHSEEKNGNKRIHLVSLDSENINTPNNVYKRQINPGLAQIGQSIESQYLQQPFGPVSSDSFPRDDGSGLNQFQNSQFLDEEDRFFFSGERTTLNPLSFFNQQSTQNPLQQQLADEQRRFQQEIADKGLREQQEQSLGLGPRPQTTTPPPFGNFAFTNFNQRNPLFQPELQDPAFANSEFSSNPPFPPLREFRSIIRKVPRRFKRSDDLQVGSNDLNNYFSSTVSPQPFVNNLLKQPADAKEDLTQISNWLIDALTKQIQRNLAQLTESTTKLYQPTLKPILDFGAPSKPSAANYRSVKYSTEAPIQIPSSVYSTPKSSDVPNWQSSTDRGIEVTQIPNWGGITSPSPDPTQIPNWNNLRSINSPFANTVAADYVEPKKVKNIQILPYSTEVPNLPISVEPLDINSFETYKQIYNIDLQTLDPIATTISTAPDFISTPYVTSTEPSQTTVSVTSLFRSKLREVKEADANPETNILQDGYSEFRQHNRFLDQLQRQPNATNGTENVTSGYDGNLGTAIFVKVPEDTPTSTVGYLFDKTLIKNLQKKENSSPKSKINNRSPQIAKSTLVYRTPPGKRATAGITEIVRNNQLENGLFTNLLLGDSPKPLQWIFRGKQHTTTSRPLVTAFLNLIH